MRVRFRVWLVVVSTVVGVVAAGGAVEPDGAAACGHLEELAAAKRALEDEDSAAALRHLKRADDLLLRCMRDGVRAHPEDEGEALDTRTG